MSSENNSDLDKIKELEEKLAKKDEEIATVKEKTSAAIKKIKADSTNEINEVKNKAQEVIDKLQSDISKENQEPAKNEDDIAPGIRKTKTFKVGYRNAYETDEFKKKLAKAKEDQAKKNKKKE